MYDLGSTRWAAMGLTGDYLSQERTLRRSLIVLAVGRSSVRPNDRASRIGHGRPVQALATAESDEVSLFGY
jgi:hypothetical protein